LTTDASADERRTRGREFEQMLRGMLTEADLAPRIRFRPVGEEIDGSFFHRGRVLLLEAKWTRDRLPASSIYQFRGKVEGKLVSTIGVFISMGGFSPDAVDALVADKVINTTLFDGDDIRAVAAQQIDFPDALDQKLRAAAETGTPYLPLRDPVSERPFDIAPQAGGPDLTLVVVEGPFDALLVHALADEFGPASRQLQVLPAGGTFNLAALANATQAAGTGNRVVIIADSDGQPQAIRRRIQAGLDPAGPETAGQTEIIVFDPTFEEVLGVSNGVVAGRRRELERDRSVLRDRMRAAGIRQLARRNPEVRQFLQALGLGRQQFSGWSHRSGGGAAPSTRASCLIAVNNSTLDHTTLGLIS
jgi:Restriction endonuclease